MDTLLGLLAVLALVMANGFFVAAEFSLVAIRRSRVEQLLAEGNLLAPAVQRGVERLDSYLAACQLGITLASLGLGWIGEPAIAGLLEPLFDALPASWAWVSAHAFAVALAFAIITTLHIVLGELAPKSLALQRTEGTALAVAAPLGLFLSLFRPIIWTMNGMGNLVLRVAGLRPASGEEHVHSVEELRYLVTASHEAGVLDEVESDIIRRVFSFGETRAYEVMTPRTEMVAVATSDTLEAVMERIATTGHTRLPVYEGGPDNVVGVIHLRDLVRALRRGDAEETPVHTVMRLPLLVPADASSEVVLAAMRRTRTQIAVLFDEHGGTAGLVTMEDLLEEIIGDVQDEFEQADEDIRIQPDGSAILNGRLSIKDFTDRFNVDVPDQDFSTMGGLVMSQLGRLPEVGDVVTLDGYDLVVASMEGLRIATIRLSKYTPDQ